MMIARTLPILLFTLLAVGGLFRQPAQAVTPIPDITLWERWGYWSDEIWSWSVLYDNEESQHLQRFALIGRYQGQYYHTDANTGDDSGWETRRFWAGFEAFAFDDFEVQLQFAFDPDHGRFVDSVKEAFVDWTPRDDVYVVVGKTRPRITQEWTTTPLEILTLERSLLVSQVVPDWTGSALAGVERGKWLAEVGAYTGSVTDDWELPESGGGWGGMGRIGYDLSDSSDINAEWLHTSGDRDAVSFAPYENVFSLNTTNRWGGYGLNTDLIFADGLDATPDAYGAMLMPYVDLAEWLQLVFRYHYAASDGDRGIRLARRYERPAVEDGSGTLGDDYHSFYTGLNVYLNGHRLKLMNGLKYSTLGGAAEYEGWTLLSGVRLYF